VLTFGTNALQARSSGRMVKSKLVDQEDLLQAVIVADSFDPKFQPLTKDRPRCLLPLLNVPMIEYSLEICAVAKVHEVFIVCCCHSDKIQEYIQ
jgi:translation initiation factor eIF-2B subunit epsilon